MLSRGARNCVLGAVSAVSSSGSSSGAALLVRRSFCIPKATLSQQLSFAPLRPTNSLFSRGLCTSSSAKKSPVMFDKAMEAHLNNMKNRYNELSQMLATGEWSNEQLISLGKEFSGLARLMTMVEERDALIKSVADLKAIEQEEVAKGEQGDAEMIELSRQEREDIAKQQDRVEQELIAALTPRDDHDDRNIVVEVRAGTGGDEASLFASEVFKMYQKYTLLQGWKWEEISLSKTEIGGFKEAQAQINGESVYKHLKFESGVHRVQRVPVNDTKIQTSAASVIVLPEAGELDVVIRPEDLRIDVYRSGGAGGQSVNKTESAVRMTHLPTGIVVAMQDERSQIQNRAKALRYIRARVYDFERQKLIRERQEMRSLAQGTGDRSDKIRTYNFPQDRVTDHRASVTVTGVSRVLSGEFLNDIIQPLMEMDETERVQKFIEKISSKK